jgi:streptogramin lyase
MQGQLGEFMKTLYCLFAVTFAHVAASQTLLPAGHFVVGNILAPGGPSDLVAVDPTSGAQQVLVQAVSYPSGLVFDALGDLFVTELNEGQIIHITRDTGQASPVCPAGSLPNALGLAIATNGDLFVNAFAPTPAVLRVNPISGAVTTLSSGGLLTEPRRIAYDPRGALLVSVGSYTPTAHIVLIDAVTGTQTLITTGDHLYAPTGMAVEADGNILVADAATGLIRVAPANGQQTVISPLACIGVVVDATGNMVVTAQNPPGVYRVDPLTGARYPVSVAGDFVFPTDIAVATAPADDDGDGVPNDRDQCPGTPAGAIVDANGCSLEQIVPCSGPASGGVWRNHGQYVSAFAAAAKLFQVQGLITDAQFDELVSAAAGSQCGK